MNAASMPSTQERCRVARAEASVWIVRLHGPHRTPELEAGFRQWLAASVDNAAEFERVTSVWESAPHASTAGLPRVTYWSEPKLNLSWAIAASVIVAITAGAWIASQLWLNPDYVTGIGEQRTVPLDDGSRIVLNSDSEVKIEFTSDTRRVRLVHGEAFFDVAHNAARPFIVLAGDQQVTAIGTAFEVRYDLGQVDVTLVEGKVNVMRTESDPQDASRELSSSKTGSLAKMMASGYLMVPGERLHIARNTPVKVDEPRIDAVTAWRRGEVMLDDTPLSDAVAEMNRYNKRALVIDEPRIAGLRVSGIYHTGDSEGFAQTVANLYGLHVSEAEHQIHLSLANPSIP
jgi:transmembrane sensor